MGFALVRINKRMRAQRPQVSARVEARSADAGEWASRSRPHAALERRHELRHMGGSIWSGLAWCRASDTKPATYSCTRITPLSAERPRRPLETIFTHYAFERGASQPNIRTLLLSRAATKENQIEFVTCC
jgi:hypothetical protein